MEPKLFLGTSGLQLPFKNKLSYPEEFKDKSRLNYYASLQNTIEINSSFYKIPMASTVKKWADDVSENFRFTFKLWREITHNKGMMFDPGAVSRFLDTIAHVGNKKGCLLVQFAPGVRGDQVRQLESMLRCIRDSDLDDAWNIAIELRHKSWYEPFLYDMLHSYKMGLVWHDKPPAITPFSELRVPFIYLRFHGPGGNYRGSYSDDFLFEYAQYIREWTAAGKEVFVYFNNTMGEALHNLNTLRDFVKYLGNNIE